MCNHCNHNGNEQEAHEYARKVFLSQIAETSTEISKMTSGVLVKTVDGQVEVCSFGSLKDILSLSSGTYLNSLEFALEKAVEEGNVVSLMGLYGHMLHVSKHIEEFLNKAGKAQEEILNSFGKDKS